MSFKRTFKFRKFCLTLVLASLSLGLSSASANAQALSGSIVGNIADSSQAIVPGATVTIRDEGTNQTRTTTTNSEGGFSFLAIEPANYEVTVTKEGFHSVKQAGVSVSVNSVTREDLQLQVGAVTETITVSSNNAELQTDTADVQSQLATETLQDLPTPPGRNYQALFTTMPGFTPPSSQVSIPGNPSRSLLFSVNGTSSQGVVTRIDGASSTNIWRPNATAYIPALEAIQNVNAVTNAFTAENGTAGGAVINVSMKSGTNAIHGSAFEYYDGNATEARPYFLATNLRNGKLVENQFGGTIGGPIIKNKLFFFASFEGSRNHQLENGGFVSIPTPAMRSGDLTASATPIYDPATGNPDGTGRTQISCNGVLNMICPDRFPYAVQQLLPLWPNPTVTTGDQNNYYATGPFHLDRETWDTKVNWTATPKLSLSLRFGDLLFSTFNGTNFGDSLGGAPLNPIGGQSGVATGHTISITGAATYVASPSLEFDTYYGYTLSEADSRQDLLNQNIGLNVLKIPGTNGSRWFEGGFPQFSLSSFAAIGAPDAIQPNLQNDPEYEYEFNVGWTRKAHSMRYGISIVRQDLNEFQAQFMGGGNAIYGPSGGFGFAPGETSIPGAKTSEYNTFASFLLGATDSLGRNYMSQAASNGYTLRSWQYGAYAQDQWQVNPKLTLTYGVRWQFYPFPERADRGVEFYDIHDNTTHICGYDLIQKQCGITSSKLLFEPRIGVAYRLSEKLVMRSGFGISHDPYNLLRPFRVNYPLMINLSIPSPNGYTAASQLQNGIPLTVEPNYGNGIIATPGNAATDTIEADKFKRGYIESFNLFLESKLGAGWTAQAGYVGTRSVDQLAYYNLNSGTVGGGTASEPYNIAYGRTASTAIVTPIGTYKYDALQSTLKHNFAGTFEVGASYTFSKSLGIAGNDNGDGTPLIEAPGYYNLNKARTDLDHTHNFSLSTVYSLPFGKGKKFLQDRIDSAILGGWQINALFSYYTGAPFNVTAPGTSLNAPGSTQRPDLLTTNVKKLGGHGPGKPYYDPTAFAQVTTARFGTAPFYFLNSPPTHVLNMGVFREFKVGDRVKLQFRTEAFNVTNTPNFAAPNGTVGSSSFMIISATQGTGREGIDQRMLRFGMHLAF